MRPLIGAIALVCCALILTACGEMGDRLVRGMASDEQIERFESVIDALQSDDPAQLEAMLSDGFDDEFAQEAVDYFPNTPRDAIVFSQFNSSTNFSNTGRTRSVSMSATVKFQRGDYYVEVIHFARGDAEFRIANLRIVPMFEEDPTEPSQADTYDPI